MLSECEAFKREQSRISQLERQAQDFLNAVFHRKGKPRTYVPHQSFHVCFHVISHCYIPSNHDYLIRIKNLSHFLNSDLVFNASYQIKWQVVCHA